MATKIRDSVNVSGTLLLEDHGKRLCFTLTNGNVLVVLRDHTGAGNTNERFLVYESSDRINWTLRATVVPPTTTFSITATCDSLNNIHIVHMSSDRLTLRHMTVTYAGFGASAWTACGTSLPAGGRHGHYDVDVSDAGQVFVVSMFCFGTGGAYGWVLYTKGSSSGWVNTKAEVLHNRLFVTGCETATIIAAGNVDVDSVTYTNVALAIGHSETIPASGNAKAKPVDKGVALYHFRIRPTTGVSLEVAASDAKKDILCAGQGYPASRVREGRVARWFRDNTDPDKIILGIHHAQMNRQIFAGRYSFESGLQAATPPNAINNQIPSQKIGGRFMAMTYANGTLFYICAPGYGPNYTRIVSFYTAKLSQAKDKFIMQTRPSFPLEGLGYIAAQTVDLVASGGQRNGQSSKTDVLFHTIKNGANQKFYHEYLKVAGTPKNLYPSTESVITTSNPSLSAYMDFDRKFMQCQSTVEFQVASNGTFTSDVINVTSDEYQVIDYTDASEGTVVSVNLPEMYTLGIDQSWYLRARNVDAPGNTGEWSPLVTFIIAHPPTASNLSPNRGKALSWGTIGNINFSWDFNDTSVTDFQTAYRIRVYNSASGALGYDSGKIVSGNEFGSATLPIGLKNIPIEWEVSLWDSNDTQGPYSPRAQFALYDAPVVNITVPTEGSTVGTPVPHVEFSVNTFAGATIKNYRVTVSQGGVVKWNSGQINANSAPSGTAFVVDSPIGVYVNNQSYSIRITVTDSRSLVTTSNPRVIKTLWVLPNAPTAVLDVDVSVFDEDDSGYVIVGWDNSGQNAEFVCYSLQRKDQMVDLYGEIVEEGEWNEIAKIFDHDEEYEYQDFVARSGHKVSYRLSQGVAMLNDVVYSNYGDEVSSYPVSSSYWLLDSSLGGGPLDALKLHSVNSDSFDLQHERSSYNVIGRGIHVDVGQRLGYVGTISAQVRETGLLTARQKRMRLEEIQDSASVMYLRNPFGDIFLVSTGDITFSRIAGVGQSEFFDVTIPYQEVSQ